MVSWLELRHNHSAIWCSTALETDSIRAHRIPTCRDKRRAPVSATLCRTNFASYEAVTSGCLERLFARLSLGIELLYCSRLREFLKNFTYNYQVELSTLVTSRRLGVRGSFEQSFGCVPRAMEGHFLWLGELWKPH